MTDTSDLSGDTGNTGGRFDSALQRARTALDGLRQDLAAKAAEIGQEVNTKLDEIQTAVDEIQAAWTARGAYPDNTLPGQPTQLPADAPVGGTPPAATGVAPPTS